MAEGHRPLAAPDYQHRQRAHEPADYMGIMASWPLHVTASLHFGIASLPSPVELLAFGLAAHDEPPRKERNDDVERGDKQ